MTSRDNRDTLLAFYGTYDERSDPSVSEPPLPENAASEVLQQTTTTSISNDSFTSPSKSAAPKPTPEPSAGHKQPSQYQPGSRAKSFVGSKQQTASSSSSSPHQQPVDSGSAFPSALQAAVKPKSPSNAPPSYTNPFTDPPSSFGSQPGEDHYANNGLSSPSFPQDRPSMDSPYSPYRSPPNSGRPLLSVDPNFAARTKLQEPPRAAFAAPASPAMSSGSTLIGSAPPSPVFAKSTMFNEAPPSSPSRDNDRFAPSERANANDFWKRFSMVVKESENEKGTSKNADWLSKQNRKTKTYKRWIAIVGLLILAIIVAVVCWQTLLVDDDGDSKSAPSEHDFGLGDASVSQHVQDRLVRRTALPRAFGNGAGRAFHGHQHRA